MKKTILLSLLAGTLGILSAQNSNPAPSPSPSGQTIKADLSGLSLYLSAGVKPLKTDQATLYFHYVDESPSRDNITEVFDMPSSMYSASVRLGAEYEFTTPFFIKLQLQGYLAKISGYSIDGGIGYSIKNKKKTFAFRPQILLSSGLTTLKLGDIYQNDLYIQVNGTQFYSNSVATSLRSRYLLIIPQLEGASKLSNNLELRYSVELPLPISKGDPYVHFTGGDISNNQVEATEAITASNMDLYLDNNPLRTQNINFTFVGFQLGLAYKF